MLPEKAGPLRLVALGSNCCGPSGIYESPTGYRVKVSVVKQWLGAKCEGTERSTCTPAPIGAYPGCIVITQYPDDERLMVEWDYRRKYRAQLQLIASRRPAGWEKAFVDAARALTAWWEELFSTDGPSALTLRQNRAVLDRLMTRYWADLAADVLPEGVRNTEREMRKADATWYE